MALSSKQSLTFSTYEPNEALDVVRKIYCDACWRLGPRSRSVAPITIFNRSFGNFALSTVGYGRAIEIEPHADDQTTMIVGVIKGQVEFSGSSSEFRGGPGSIAVLSSLEGSRFRYDEEAETYKFIFDRRRIDTFIARMTGLPVQRAQFALQMRSEAHCHLWMGFFRTFQEINASHGVAQRANIIQLQLEEMLMTALLQTQDGHHTPLLDKPAATIAPKHVKAVSDYVLRHLPDSLSLGALAAVGECSIRSLTRGFNATYQCSPMQFIRHERLKRVRADLKNKGLDRSTVTEIAMANGFNHMGEFARHYRLAFGELPTETRQ
ncbi:MAG: AraC family transcriptional regulator [Nitrospiraceae bacterium]|nr:AraC family transcriptional regulator [Nitrospiraceae bacterium]